ncbi:unnamed protein product [Schistosoma mattheei]|uniref:Uncharacterized protein n=1 Tax=Schistosoma mattheei TaxID=31246 RepID=A0A3P8GJ70_9TREM|nr:unnamed protein product [Schistosoma mattheei]
MINAFQLLFILSMSDPNSRHSVFFGLPLFRFSSELQASACFVMQFGDLRNIYPIRFQRLFLISSSAGSWFVLSQYPVVDGIHPIDIEYLE